MLSPKENYLAAISFQSPQYVPRANEDIYYSFSFKNIIKNETWTDRWGIDWKVELKDTVPFPKGNPLSNIRKIDSYKFPDPNFPKVNLDALWVATAEFGKYS